LPHTEAKENKRTTRSQQRLLMSRLTLHLLGAPRLERDSAPVRVTRRKVMALLAYLAVTDQPHSREGLVTLLSPELEASHARAEFRRTLAVLKRTLGSGHIQADRETVALRQTAPELWLDVAQFRALLAPCQADAHPSGTPGVCATCAPRLQEAVGLYRDDFMAGFNLPDSLAFEEWQFFQAETLRDPLTGALQRLIRWHRDQAPPEFEPAIAYSRRWLALNPLHEPAHRELMALYVLAGRRAAALRQYEVCCQVLQDELGVEPAAETTALYERIRAGERDARARRVPAIPKLRGYILQDVIGAGAFGVVYRAHQPHVEREVAVKIILPEYANQPDFIRRFEAEAQLVAGLEHLHIVPLYDYWRELDGAYLVMRLMRGGSLEEALAGGALDLEAVVQIVDQVGSALAAAHQQDVVHRDIKPANILLDEEGNAYLSDFGIAKDLGGRGGGGTPGYLSPEQVRGEPVSPQTDIYSFGVVLYELLAGQRPFPDTSAGELLIEQYNEPLPSLQETCPDLPAALDGVVQRATAREAAERYPDVLAMVTDVRQALGGAVPAESWAPQPELPLLNPFKGLRAFLEADADDFFGREALTQRLVRRLCAEDGTPPTNIPFAPPGNASRFLAVVGASGSGKSSVVRAGLVPALRRGALPGSEEWFVVQMLPGSHPLEELEIGLLRVAARPSRSLMEQLRRDARGILRAARLVLPEEGQLLLVIDQFEELFTLVEDGAERRHFMDSLYVAVTDPRSPVWVVVTLRADFYDRPLMHPEFSSLVQEQTEVVVPLTVEELERAIRGPAERVGATLESGLVTTIVADVHEQPGALPLLQYALTELFERREGRVLTATVYQEIGGVMGALGRRAEEVYQGLGQEGREAARQLFLRLVTLGEGTEDTRRRALRAELEAVTMDNGRRATDDGKEHNASVVFGPASVMGHVIDTFGRARLLSFDRDPLTRGPTLEVAHEALLREWRRLREWLDTGRADVRTQRVLANAAAEWRSAERDASFLLRGSRLDQFEGWAAETELALTPDERAFLDASSEERRRREELQRAQQERELALEHALVRRLRVIVGVLLAASVVGILLTLAVFRQSRLAQDEAASRATQQAIAETERGRAETEARLAAARELAAAAASNLEVDPERSILLALQAVDTTYQVDQTVLAEAEANLHQALLASHLRATLTRKEWGAALVYDVAFSADGERLAIGVGNDTAVIWDLEGGQPLRTLDHPKKGAASVRDNGVRSVVFDPQSARLATAGADGEVKIWDADSGQELTSLGRLSLLGFVSKVRFSPEGTRLATVSADGTPRVWDVDSGQELFPLAGHTGTVWDVAFSPECVSPPLSSTRERQRTGDGGPESLAPHASAGGCGGLLATGDDGTAQIWDATTGEKLLTLPGHSGPVWAVAFSPDGAHLATASADGTAKVWDISTGQQRLSLTGHADQVMDVAFSPEGTRLATASADGTARVWDLATGKQLLSLAGHTDLVSAVAFSPEGTRLATASADGTAKVWDITPDQELLSFPSGTVYDMALSQDGTRLATTSARGTATVWDLATGQDLLTVSDEGHLQPLDTVEFGSGGERLAPGVAFSPECVSPSDGGPERCGTRLATAGSRQTAKVWDLATGELLLTLRSAGFVNAIAFSPDGNLLATSAEDSAIRIWDATSGEKLFDLTGLHSGPVKHVLFSPDGALLATAGSDGTAVIWDAATGWHLFRLSGHTSDVTYAAFSPDGERLATASRDTTVKIWDVHSGEELVTLSGHNAAVNSVAFSPECVSPPLPSTPERQRSGDGGPERCGTRLASASADGTARIWDPETGAELLSISTHPIGVGRVAFSRECVSPPLPSTPERQQSGDGGPERCGTRLITANWDKTVRVYVLSIDELITLARSRVTRGLTDEECLQYLHVEGCPE
jgi:WD40 repeat protein/serine/threonine protein kinase/DNA-binding SARP family transcriptional activator